MLKWINKKRNKKGFTLVELVVVIAILGVLAAIAVPKLGGFRKNAALAADKATAATIGKAAELYVAANGEKDIEKIVGKNRYVVQVSDELNSDFLDMLDNNITPQQDSKKSFYLKWNGSNFEVYLGEPSTDNLLYPEPKDE